MNLDKDILSSPSFSQDVRTRSKPLLQTLPTPSQTRPRGPSSGLATDTSWVPDPARYSTRERKRLPGIPEYRLSLVTGDHSPNPAPPVTYSAT
eukprot:5405263-Pyramimonas_sp.AAC.1